MLSTSDRTNKNHKIDDYDENILPSYNNTDNIIDTKSENLNTNNSQITQNTQVIQNTQVTQNPTNISNLTRNITNIEQKDYDEIEKEENNMTELNRYNTGNLILVYDEADNKFTFYNTNNSILGSFNFKQIIKYIGKQIDPSFYNLVEAGYSEELIKSMLAEISIDPITGKINTVLKSHIDSPFMGNLDLLIRLNNLFYIYEINNLTNDLTLIKDEKLQYNLKLSVKQFIYLLINHTLKIISIATDEIKNDPAHELMSKKLLKYSVALTYRISNFMKEHLDNYNKQYKTLHNQMQKLADLKGVINNKITKLEEKITKQNNLIFSIIKGKKINIEESSINLVNSKEEQQNTKLNNFDKLFQEDNDKNNYYESELIITDFDENYDLTEKSDCDEII